MKPRNTTRSNVSALFGAFVLTFWVTSLCHADPYCSDNNGNSPYVCVDKDGPDPIPDVNFAFDFQADPDNPDVTFWTANDGWKVWSQVSETNETPANLGDLKIDPTLPTDNFSVTVAHGEAPGAANIKSIVLDDENWEGYSNLTGGRMSGDLTGDLYLQRAPAGQGGSASFTIAGIAEGDLTIPVVVDVSIGTVTSTRLCLTNQESANIVL